MAWCMIKCNMPCIAVHHAVQQVALMHNSKSHAHAAVQEVLCLAQIEAGEVEGFGHDGCAAVMGAQHLLRRYSS